MPEHILYDHDCALPEHFDIRADRLATPDTLKTLWHLVAAMQEREMAMLVRTAGPDIDGGPMRLTFSTHPDTIQTTAKGAR